MVTTPAGTRHFFPGTTEELALAIATVAFTDGTLEHPKTRIEYGNIDGIAWYMKEIVKPGFVPVPSG